MSLVKFNRYFTDVLKEILPTPMSAESLSTSLRRNDVTTAITVFNMNCSLMTKRHQYMSERMTGQNEMHLVVHFVRAQWFEHRTHD